MMAYYYFLYRIYKYYKDKQGENDFQAIFATTAVSTVVLNFHLIALYIVSNYYGLIPIVTNNSIIALFAVAIGCVNHYIFVREKKFLSYNFQKDRKGGFLVIAYMVFSLVLVLIVGKYNRDRIFNESKDKTSNQPRKESLEGKIRKWFE